MIEALNTTHCGVMRKLSIDQSQLILTQVFCGSGGNNFSHCSWIWDIDTQSLLNYSNYVGVLHLLRIHVNKQSVDIFSWGNHKWPYEPEVLLKSIKLYGAKH